MPYKKHTGMHIEIYADLLFGKLICQMNHFPAYLTIAILSR